MQISTAEALILGTRTLQEADQIVEFLTRDGKHSGVARGARKKFSRYAGQLQLLSKVQVDWSEKSGRDLVRLSTVELVRPAGALHRDLEGIMVASYLADTIQQFAQRHEDNDHLYRLLDSVVGYLLDGGDRDLAVRYFEVWVLRIAGLFPAPIECPLCGLGFTSGAGHERSVVLGGVQGTPALVCGECGEGGGAAGAEVSQSAVEFLLRISRELLSAVQASRPDGRVLGEIERLCRTIRRAFLQDEIRSYRVMKQTLAER